MSGLALKLLKERALKRLDAEGRKKNSDDIYYEWVRDRRSGKLKKQKRKIPDELSDNDKAILRRIRKKAYRYDQGLGNCCGFRFGITPIIGLFPVVGDIIQILMSLTIVREAGKLDGGLPKRLYSMMIFNIAVNFGLGFFPGLGEPLDFLWRANTRNGWLIDAYLTEKAKALREGVIRDPDDEKMSITVPPELRGGDIEEGRNAARTAQPTPPAPAAVRPTRKPAPRSNMAHEKPTARHVDNQPRSGRR